MKSKMAVLLILFLVFFSSVPAFALNANERLWVIGQNSSESPSVATRTLHVFNQTGQRIRTMPGQANFLLPLFPSYSVNGPWQEFWFTRDSSGVYAVNDKGHIWKKLLVPLGPFYAQKQNLAYMLHEAGLVKISLLASTLIKEDFILKSSDYGLAADHSSRLAVDRQNRIYFSIANHLFRFTEIPRELLDEEINFSVLGLDTSINEAYIAAGEDGVMKVSSSFGISFFSGLPTNHVAVDAQGNVYVLTGSPVEIWQIAPNGTATKFSDTTFESVSGLALTHGEIA